MIPYAFHIILPLQNDERLMSVIADKTLFLKQSLQVLYIRYSLKVQFDTDVILPEVKHKKEEKVAYN